MEPVQKLQSSPAMDPEMATSRRNNYMKDHPLLGWQASRRNPQVHRYNAPGEIVAYAALFKFCLWAVPSPWSFAS